MSHAEAAAVLSARAGLRPRVGIVLGSGLGAVAEAVEGATSIEYADLPGFPRPTVAGHGGRAVLGRIGAVPVAVLLGRAHVYEGGDLDEVRTPVRALRAAGADSVVLTNAAGSLRPELGPGSLMAISDHINLSGVNVLAGPNDDRIGPRFPDLTDAWSTRLRALLHESGRDEGVALEEGVYAGLLGPNYETPAEVRMLRTLGADAVGMSTVLEALAARWAGMEVCGVSLITNAGAGISPTPLTHEEVLEAAAEAGPSLARVLRRFVRLLAAVGEGTPSPSP